MKGYTYKRNHLLLLHLLSGTCLGLYPTYGSTIEYLSPSVNGSYLPGTFLIWSCNDGFYLRSYFMTISFDWEIKICEESGLWSGWPVFCEGNSYF